MRRNAPRQGKKRTHAALEFLFSASDAPAADIKPEEPEPTQPVDPPLEPHERENSEKSPNSRLPFFETWTPTVFPADGRNARRMEGYLLCYGMGAFTVRVWRRLLLWIYILLTPAGHLLFRVWDWLVLRQVRAVRWELHRIRYGFTLAGERVRLAAQRSVMLAIVQILLLPVLALRRHRRLLSLLLQGTLLTASALVLIGVLRYWNNTTFALELQYGGRSVGYIADEAVFQNAVDMAEGRVIKTSSGTIIEREPHMTLRPVHQSLVLSETELCDQILRMSGSSVTRLSGLYVDGKFEGALTTHDLLQTLLDTILAEYDTAADTANKTAEFMSRVEIIDGLYPLTAEENYEELLMRLTKTDEAGNPYLGVQIRCTEVYDEAIPFEKTTVRDATKYIGYSAVRTKGVEGILQITADVIYVNGTERYREILSEEILRQPVTQVTAVGSYTVNADAKPGVATGSFMWPVPSCHSIYSTFGYRSGRLHAGIDISGSGINGRDILASDGGVVRQVNASGWGGGYGLYVIIDHGHGYTSVYAHCSAILVKAGDRVTQGQLIARVGSTGDSRAPHLHFEIRVNGASVDPVPYVK